MPDHRKETIVMSTEAIITLQELQCIRQDRGSDGASPYIWPAMVVIDRKPFLISVVTPESSASRVVIQTGMQSGQTASIPSSVGDLESRLEGDELTQFSVLLVIALWEQRDTPDNVASAGFQAYNDALGPAIQANILLLNSSNPMDVQAGIAAVKAAVKSAVTATVKNSLTWYQELEIYLGLMTLDSLIDSSFHVFHSLVNGSFSVTFGGGGNRSNDYVINGNLQLEPVIDPPTTVVPNVYEMTPNTATHLVQAAKLVPHFAGNGTWVSSQSPLAGMVVVQGTTVNMALHTGPKP
jgi:hypothetical protein